MDFGGPYEISRPAQRVRRARRRGERQQDGGRDGGAEYDHAEVHRSHRAHLLLLGWRSRTVGRT
ncbi:hypothetical protein [Streptomyces sp. S1]|uniref:hypothetical protein n=1 Tax=Streptomyces sp. S1 TaxID=718288 RepID=UPI003D703592